MVGCEIAEVFAGLDEAGLGVLPVSGGVLADLFAALAHSGDTLEDSSDAIHEHRDEATGDAGESVSKKINQAAKSAVKAVDKALCELHSGSCHELQGFPECYPEHFPGSGEDGSPAADKMVQRAGQRQNQRFGKKVGNRIAFKKSDNRVEAVGEALTEFLPLFREVEYVEALQERKGNGNDFVRDSDEKPLQFATEAVEKCAGCEE